MNTHTAARVGRLTAFFAAATLAALGVSAAGAQAGSLRVLTRIPGPDGLWDYVSADPVHHQIYIAHGKAVSSINTQTGELTPKFADGGHVHSVLPIPGINVLLTTNADDGTARFINEDDGSLIASMPAGKKPDGATYDPASGTAIVVDGDLGDLYFIDVAGRKVTDHVHVEPGLEGAVVDGKGKLFLNSSDARHVVVMDIRSRKVIGHFAEKGCDEPTALAYVAGDRLISTCSNQVAKVLDARHGHELASLKIGLYPDAVIYDATRHLAYVPAAETGDLTVIGLAGRDDNKVVERVKTQTGARTGAVDPETGRIYLPAADYPVAPHEGKRTPWTPGSFTVLVVGQP